MKFMFMSCEHKFISYEHKFVSREHKFTSYEHRIVLDEKENSACLSRIRELFIALCFFRFLNDFS